MKGEMGSKVGNIPSIHFKYTVLTFYSSKTTIPHYFHPVIANHQDLNLDPQYPPKLNWQSLGSSPLATSFTAMPLTSHLKTKTLFITFSALPTPTLQDRPHTHFSIHTCVASEYFAIAPFIYPQASLLTPAVTSSTLRPLRVV